MTGFLQHDVMLSDQTGDAIFAPRPEFEVEWLDANGHPVA